MIAANHGCDRSQWDFDVVVESWTETLSPGNELRDYWGSQAAVTPGSWNIIGIADKVDSLIQRVVFAKNREELVAAAERSTAFCYGMTTSFRSGPTAKSAVPAGTGLASQTGCLFTACRRFRRFGGGTPGARPKRRRDRKRPAGNSLWSRSHHLAPGPNRVLERRSAANVACPTRTKEGPTAASMRNLARRSPVEHSSQEFVR
jgi:hypothetical protein